MGEPQFGKTKGDGRFPPKDALERGFMVAKIPFFPSVLEIMQC